MANTRRVTSYERRRQLRRGVGLQSSIRILFGPRREWSQYNLDREMELSSKYKVKCFPSNCHGKVAEKNTRNLCDDSHLQKWDSNVGTREFEEWFDVQVTVYREKFL